MSNIKNADMPAMPLVNDAGHPFHVSDVAFDNYPLIIGLTKREMFAMHAMHAMITGGGYDKWEYIARDAYELADVMLEEREKWGE